MDEQDQSQYYKQQYDEIKQRERLEAEQRAEPSSPGEDEQGPEEEGGSFTGGPKSRLDQMKNKENLENIKKQAQERAKSKLGKEASNKLVEQAGKQVAQKAATSAAASAGGGWVAFWVAVGIIIVVIAIILFVVVTGAIYQKCNDDSWTGTAIRTGSTVAKWLGATATDICKNFKTSDNFGGGKSGGGGGGADYSSDSVGLSAEQARAYLAAHGITVNNREPSYPGEPNTTSLEGILLPTLEQIVWFKNNCDQWSTARGFGACTVVFTGGTEEGAGHVAGPGCTHQAGRKFDMRVNDNVNRFIQTLQIQGGIFTPSGLRSGRDPIYINPFAIPYVLEAGAVGGPHWDVAVCSGT